jgi:phage repressor protein C with HTH and peptisase S24 domain
MSRKHKSATPEWCRKVLAFRHELKVSQQELGNRLGKSAMTVSRWECGEGEPSGKTYIALGNLAGDPLCWYFWQRAGLSSGDIIRVLSKTLRRRQTLMASTPRGTVHASVVTHAGVPRDDFVAVPLLPIYAATPGESGDMNFDFAMCTPEMLLTAPRPWCPNPDATVCMRVRGGSMSPLILDGYIIAVDTSNTLNDSLIGQIVVAHHENKGLLVSRLMRFNQTDVLASDHREYESLSITTAADWKIVGKVLWWTGRAT